MRREIVKKEQKDRDSGVSPVIGVMLMLVVTIIIAALVTSFVGELGGNTEKVPSAALSVKIISNGGPDKDQYVMLIEHLGGDPIVTSEMKIASLTTFRDSATGKPVEFQNDVTSNHKKVKLNFDGNSTEVRIPYLVDPTKGKPGDAAVDFGNFVFMPGDVLSSGTTAGTGVESGGYSRTTSMLGFSIDNYKDKGFGRGTSVDVKIVHIPSQKLIYSDRVNVE